MIDTHCHLDVPAFDADRGDVLKRAWDSGLSGLLVPAIGPAAFENLLSFSQTDARLAVALGLHPQALPDLPEADDDAHLERLDACLSRNVAVAVGECGLDGGVVDGAPMERQVRVFRAHLALARKHQLPLSVHCLRAHPALLEVLKEERPVPGLLLHSYSGGAALVKEYAALGCHFSFAGPVTWERARKPLEAASAVSLDRLMVETDAPDQTPVPHRGGRCEPAYLFLVLEALARHLSLPFSTLVEHTTQNAQRFFRYRFGT